MSGAQVGARLPFKNFTSKNASFRPELLTNSFNRNAKSLLRGQRTNRRTSFPMTGQRMLAVQAHVEPAVLPGTTQNFPIKEAELIELAKKYFNENPGKPPGATDDSCLAPDFKFEFPLVKLDKERYLKAVRTFDFTAGVPNIQNNAYDYRVDKYEPQRVWWTVRVSGTHTGTLKVFTSKIKPTGRPVLGAPECMSMTFNTDGKITSLTGGYVIDNRLGTCNKMGGLYGILQSMGVFVPYPQSGTLGWKVGCAVDTGVNLVTKVLHFFTFGVFKEKPKTA